MGWNIATGLAEHHDVWVLTRANNRQPIETELAARPVPGINFVYYDLPNWTFWWKQRGETGVQLYYYLWQIGISRVVEELHREIGFDLSHHLTLGKYWGPSMLSRLPIPFVLGPVGGGEAAPRSYYRSYGLRGVMYEVVRSFAQRLSEFDPLVRSTVRRSDAVLVATRDTAARLRVLGARRIHHVPGQTGVTEEELQTFATARAPETSRVRFLTVGRLLHWKGVHLALHAFAAADLADAEYWIVGDGPERKRLEKIAASLGIQDRVVFCGQLPREEALRRFESCHVVIHPSLHDFSPTVIFEAMAAGKPVLCLNLGGPAMQVDEESGIRVPAATPEQAIEGLAEGMQRLAGDAHLRDRMGSAGRQRVASTFTWDQKVRSILEVYETLHGTQRALVALS